MGTREAASASVCCRSSFRNIILSLVVGVCGGVPTQTDSGDSLLGDIIISQQIVDLAFGRQYDNHFSVKDTLSDRHGRPNGELRAFLSTVNGKRDRERLKAKSLTYLAELCRTAGFNPSQPSGNVQDIAYPRQHRHKHQQREPCAICVTCQAAEAELEEAVATGKPNDEIKKLEEKVKNAAVCVASETMSCDDLHCDKMKGLPRGSVKRPFITGSKFHEPEIHFGVIGSGTSVLRSGYSRDELAAQRKIIAFEMEGSGAWEIFPTVVIKAVCDYADSHKSKRWQDYAAASAASCAKAFLTEWTVVDGSLPTMTKANAQTETYNVLFQSLAFHRMDARLLNVAVALPDTCQWLQRHPCFRAWTNPARTQEHGGFLWIKGKPGSGKSTIMKSIVEWAKRHWSKEIIVTYFFNARSPNALEKLSLGLYRFLVHQYLSSCPHDQTTFVRYFGSKVREGSEMELEVGAKVDEWTEIELQNFLVDIVTVRSQQQITLFIDALDEGSDDDVRNMLGYLETLTQRARSVQVCLASRHYPYITIRKGLSIELENQSAHASDIAVYISRKLAGAESAQMQGLRDQVRLRSSGIFLWVVLVVSSLNKMFDHGQSLQHQFRHLDKVPPDLRLMFASIFSRDSQDLDKCLILLHWVMFALTPLDPTQLHTAVAYCSSAEPDSTLSDEDPSEGTILRSLIHCSRGLVEVTTQSSRTVQFIHETVRDFLRDRSVRLQGMAVTDGGSGPGLDFQDGRCHLKIAEECVRYLIDLSKMMRLAHPLASYAAKYWWQHIRPVD